MTNNTLECGHSIKKLRYVKGFKTKIIIDSDGDKWERDLCYCNFCKKTFYWFKRFIE